jgi:carboxymethylenebutenolidase
MITFSAGEGSGNGYLALPAGGSGPGVLVLHAWWGLTDTFKAVCDRLAGAGFVALAPDLHRGRTAATIDEAKALVGMAQRDPDAVEAIALGALAHLRAHPAVRGDHAGIVGFSMGG